MNFEIVSFYWFNFSIVQYLNCRLTYWWTKICSINHLISILYGQWDFWWIEYKLVQYCNCSTKYFVRGWESLFVQGTDLHCFLFCGQVIIEGNLKFSWYNKHVGCEKKFQDSCCKTPHRPCEKMKLSWTCCLRIRRAKTRRGPICIALVHRLLMCINMESTQHDYYGWFFRWKTEN